MWPCEGVYADLTRRVAEVVSLPNPKGVEAELGTLPCRPAPAPRITHRSPTWAWRSCGDGRRTLLAVSVGDTPSVCTDNATWTLPHSRAWQNSGHTARAAAARPSAPLTQAIAIGVARLKLHSALNGACLAAVRQPPGCPQHQPAQSSGQWRRRRPAGGQPPGRARRGHQADAAAGCSGKA